MTLEIPFCPVEARCSTGKVGAWRALPTSVGGTYEAETKQSGRRGPELGAPRSSVNIHSWAWLSEQPERIADLHLHMHEAVKKPAS